MLIQKNIVIFKIVMVNFLKHILLLKHYYHTGQVQDIGVR